MADRTVYFGKINREHRLFDTDFRADLLAAIDPRKQVTRYRRTWRFSRPIELDETHVAGKLGFTRHTPTAETTYDENLQDFVTAQADATEGSFSLFVVDTAREIVAFDTQPPLIRPQSFIGNFQALLASTDVADARDFPATVELLTDPTGFDRWAETVERIVRIRAVVFNPNPGWRDPAGALRQIVEEADADKAEVVAVAPEDGALNAHAPWVEGALGQIAEHGQGRLSAVGVTARSRTRWESWTMLRTAALSDDIRSTAEQAWAWLRSKIEDLYGR